METLIADENMKKFFIKLLTLKAFVKEKAIEIDESNLDDNANCVMNEIYKQLDAIIKNGDENE